MADPLANDVVVDPAAAFLNIPPTQLPDTSPSESTASVNDSADPALLARARELEKLLAVEQAAPVIQDFIEADAEDTAGEPLPPVSNAPRAVPARARPVPEAQLSPEQKRIRVLEDQLARAQARKLDSDTATEYEPRGAGELVEFYVQQDGWTAWGNVWYRGQEFAIEVDSQAWIDTLDRNGDSFLRYLDDESAQMAAYGDIMIRLGRWPGKAWPDPRAAAIETARNRAAPILRV